MSSFVPGSKVAVRGILIMGINFYYLVDDHPGTFEAFGDLIITVTCKVIGPQLSKGYAADMDISNHQWRQPWSPVWAQCCHGWYWKDVDIWRRPQWWQTQLDGFKIRDLMLSEEGQLG